MENDQRTHRMPKQRPRRQTTNSTHHHSAIPLTFLLSFSQPPLMLLKHGRSRFIVSLHSMGRIALTLGPVWLKRIPVDRSSIRRRGPLLRIKLRNLPLRPTSRLLQVIPTLAIGVHLRSPAWR